MQFHSSPVCSFTAGRPRFLFGTMQSLLQNPLLVGHPLVWLGNHWDTAPWLLPCVFLSPSREPQAQNKHMSRFSSTAPASHLVSSPFILKGPGLHDQLCGRSIHDPLKSCLVISQQQRKQMELSYPFLPRHNTNGEARRASTLAATLAPPSLRKSVSSGHLPMLHSSSPPYHRIHRLQG